MRNNKTNSERKVILSVSVSQALYDELQKVVEKKGLNRSAFVSLCIYKCLWDLEIREERLNNGKV